MANKQSKERKKERKKERETYKQVINKVVYLNRIFFVLPLYHFKGTIWAQIKPKNVLQNISN
jgi:FMN-dependent NADH-azoreductase